MKRATPAGEGPPPPAGPGERAGWLQCVAAPCEFVGLFLASIVIQRLAGRALGVPGWKSTQAEMVLVGEADFLVLSKLAAFDQLVRYGVLLGGAFLVGWWHRRRGGASYGLTRGGHRWRELVAIGVGVWAVAKLLPAVLLAADDHFPWIGSGPAHWALFPDVWTFEFLLYLAVSSFLLVAVLEELAFRGYLIGRFREDFGQAGALVLSSTFFTLAHTQYFRLEVLSLGMTASLAIGSLAFGYALIRTGSLVPCVVAHALANLPVPPGEWSEEILLAVALAVVVVSARPLARWMADFGRLFRDHRSWKKTLVGLTVLLAALGALIVLRDRAGLLAAVLLAIGLGCNALDRRSAARAPG